MFIKMNLFKVSTFEDVYIFCVKSNFHFLFYKRYLNFDKYVNELYYFNIFNFISNIDIRSNYQILFKFIKNVNKRFYIYFDIYKNEIFNIF